MKLMRCLSALVLALTVLAVPARAQESNLTPGVEFMLDVLQDPNLSEEAQEALIDDVLEQSWLFSPSYVYIFALLQHCRDTLLSDQYACTHSGLPWWEIEQCAQDAYQRYLECVKPYKPPHVPTPGDG